jgi:hypothetical protein
LSSPGKAETGWASTTVVSGTYAHADVHDPAFDAALRRVWGQQR